MTDRTYRVRYVVDTATIKRSYQWLYCTTKKVNDYIKFIQGVYYVLR